MSAATHTEQAIIEQFSRIKTGGPADQPKPHKPLLALWAIGQCLKGKDRLVRYDEVEKHLTELLKKYAKPPYRPEHPFWRLKNDNVWEFTNAEKVRTTKSGDAFVADLRSFDVGGGFPSHIYTKFRNSREFAWKIAQFLLMRHFPVTWHSEIVNDTLGHEFVGSGIMTLPFLEETIARRKRSATFRRMILENFDFQCAVCGYSINYPVDYWPALEAAHIKWHSHNGPDIRQNGLSLCVLHHELFDWGIFTIDPDSLKIEVTPQLLEQSINHTLTCLHERELEVIPKIDRQRPAPEFLDWHRHNIFGIRKCLTASE